MAKNLKPKMTQEELDDIEMNANNATRGLDNYDEMTDKVEDDK